MYILDFIRDIGKKLRLKVCLWGKGEIIEKREKVPKVKGPKSYVKYIRWFEFMTLWFAGECLCSGPPCLYVDVLRNE